MSDVTLADCYVIGGNLQPPRPMTPDDLDSLIRERGVTEVWWCEVHRQTGTKPNQSCVWALAFGGKRRQRECRMGIRPLLAALSGTEEE